MNCPACKNPIQESSKECEWCGSVVPHIEKLQPENAIEIILIFEGCRRGFGTIEIFVDQKKIGSGSFYEGFEFIFRTTKNRPLIEMKYKEYSTNLKFLPDIYFEFGQSYTIVLDTDMSNITGFSSKPKSITRNNGL